MTSVFDVLRRLLITVGGLRQLLVSMSAVELTNELIDSRLLI